MTDTMETTRRGALGAMAAGALAAAGALPAAAQGAPKTFVPVHGAAPIKHRSGPAAILAFA